MVGKQKGIVTLMLALLGAMQIMMTGARADVRLASLFSDHMIFQSGVPAPVWGDAAPGEQITVRLLNQTKRTVASINGQWLVTLDPLPVTEGTIMQVSGVNLLTVNDVAVGEVWLASGQSNMEWMLQNTSDLDNALKEANDPGLRLFKVEKATSEEPLGDANGSWKLSTPEAAKPYTAVGWYFGRELRKKLKVPIGIIHSSWSGTEAEAWTSLAALQANPTLRPLLERWDRYLDDFPSANERYHNVVLPRWDLQRQQAKTSGKPEPERPREPVGPNSPHRPANLFNAMIAPLVPYALRGVIWYQGESNASRAFQYRTLLPTLIQDWRFSWGVQNPSSFPFYIVQIANFRPVKTEPGESDLAELREAQTLTAAMPGNGLALSIDIGEANDIHPKNKRDVGRRLALVALSQTYGQRLEYSGPVFDGMRLEGNRLRLRFTHAKGLMSRADPIPGFAIAGEDHKWKWAKARIEGEEIVLWNENITAPIAVRYAWADNPKATIYNSAGLPAVPFRTDDWPMITRNNN